jgi:hypothetical protein
VTKLAILLALLALACSSNTPCATVRDCTAGDRCVSKQCQGPGANGLLGDSCNTDDECGSGLKCNPLAIGFPHGFCTSDCSSAPCTSGVCTALSSGSSVCTPTCHSDSDCRQQYVCCAAVGNVCVPSASCVSASCSRPVATSALPAAQVVELGTHQVGDTVSFSVPANTGSITIVHQAKIAGLTVEVSGSGTFENSAVPLTVTKPDGSKAFDLTQGPPSSADGGVEPASEYALFGGGQGSTAAFTMPNTTASLNAGIPAGTWKFVVNDLAADCANNVFACSDGGTTSNTYDVSVLLRPLPAGTALNANFYIVGNESNSSHVPFTAANAGSDPAAQRMVQTFKGIFAAAGVTVSNVAFFDVSAAAQAEFGTSVNADETAACDLLDQMFTLSGAHAGNAVNIFLVQGIVSNSSSNAGIIVGIDGSIPGPSTLNGTVHSGAAVSMADLFAGICGPSVSVGSCGADKVAYIAAHETGHFLGLFHTTEMEGDSFDGIADSAKCPCLTCASTTDQAKCGKDSASGQPLVTAARCVNPGAGCGGGDNLMFWLLDSSVSRGKLTTQQAQVIMLNPAVQ